MFKRSVLDALEKVRLANRKGLLLPSAVVAAARPKDSPLHRYFTWDRDKAHLKLLLQEARGLIVKVEIFRDDIKEQPVQVYCSLDADRHSGGGYRHVDQVASDPALRSEMLKTALREFQQLSQRYHRLQRELSPVMREVRRLEKRTKKAA